MLQLLQLIASPDMVASTIRLATPIAYAALGAMICERAGVINIALEGTLLTSAFCAILASYFTGSALFGVAGGLAGGILISTLFGVLVLPLRAQQVIVGAALNATAMGLFGYLSFALFHSPGVTPTVQGIDAVAVPLLSEIPWFGPAFFVHTPTVLFLPFAALLCWAVVFRSPFGLRLRVAGEAPRVDEAAGVNVVTTRFYALILAGGIVALGGINLSLETLKYYQDSMVAGRGFIALAANIFGGWSALGGVLTSLLFGFSQALMFRVQIFRIPQEFIFMLPYVLTLLVLLGAGQRVSAPAALGQPFRRRQ